MRRRPAGRQGIGASAGGLEALAQFFSQVPADSGLAHGVVQHLDPHAKRILTELLRRASVLPVAQAVNQELVAQVEELGRAADDVRALQGRINLRSAPGQGSCFEVWLPRVDGAAAAADPLQALAALRAAPAPLNGRSPSPGPGCRGRGRGTCPRC